MAEPVRGAAAFLDRDGTIIRDTGFLRDPAQVELLPGAAQAIRRCNEAGLPVIVVSNQSGIARGFYPESAYHAVQARMVELLGAEAGAHIDASYFCPHHPEFTGPCECRKPGLLLFQQASKDLGINLSQSVWIGDRPSDIEPGQRLGGRCFLVRTGKGTRHLEAARALGVAVFQDLAEVVEVLYEPRMR